MSTTSSRLRVSVAALSLSAAAFVGLVVKEGYTDRANFTRAFKKLTGKSPSEYREVFAGRLAEKGLR